MNRTKKQSPRISGGLAALGAACLLAATLGAGLEPRGSLDAVKVVTPGPATQPAEHGVMPGHPGKPEGAKVGALRVLVSQGTKGGPPIVNDPVTVQLLSLGKVLRTYKAQVKDGAVELHDLPLDPPFQPVVTVTHSGSPEQLVGGLMHKYLPAVELEMKVYELTAEKPAWTVGIRDIEAKPVLLLGGGGAVGIQVTEMMGGFNPTDKAWIGAEAPGSAGKGNELRTMTIPLPATAQDVVFGEGMLEARAEVFQGAVVRHNTMLPGSTAYIFQYVVPAKDGKATLSFTAPADITLFAMYAPGQWKVEKVTGLEVGQASGANGQTGRSLLKAKSMKAGAVATVEFSGITPPLPEVDQTLPAGGLHLPRTKAPAATTGKEIK